MIFDFCFFFLSFFWFVWNIEVDANGSPHRNRHMSAMQEDASDLESSAAMKIVMPDSDDYKLVFISSDSSSKEDDLEDSSSTSSSTNNNRHSLSLDDCDWDYFEPSAAKTIFRDLSHSPCQSPDAHRRRVAANISPLDSPLFYRRGLNVTDAGCLRRHRLRESDTGTDEELLAQPESSSPTSSDGFVDIRRNLSRFKRPFRHSVSKSSVCNDATKKCDCGHQPPVYVPIPVPVPILLPLAAFRNWQSNDLLVTTTDEDDDAVPARSQQLRAIQKKQAAELFQLWNSAAPDLILKQHGQQTATHNEHQRGGNECRVESKTHENHKKVAATNEDEEDAARMQASAVGNDLAMHTHRCGFGREQQCDECKTTSVEKQTPANDVVAQSSLSKSKQTTMTDDKNRNCTLANGSHSSTDNHKQSNRIDSSSDAENNLQIASAIEKPLNGGNGDGGGGSETTAIVAEAIDHEVLPQSSEVASNAATNSISDLLASVVVDSMANKFRLDLSPNNKNRIRKQQPRGTTFTLNQDGAGSFGDDTPESGESECVSSSDDENGQSIHRNYDVAGASRRTEDQFVNASSDDVRSPSSSARECQSSSAAEATDTSDNETNHRRPKSKGFYKVFVVNKRNGASSGSDSRSSNGNSTDDSSDNDTDTDCGIVLNYVKMLPENEEEVMAASACESIDGDESGLDDDNDEIVLCSIKQLNDDDENGASQLPADSENDSNVNECNNEEVDLDVQSIATIECNDEDDDDDEDDASSSLSNRSADVSIDLYGVDDVEMQTATVVEAAATNVLMHSMEIAELERNNSFDVVKQEQEGETVMQQSSGQDSSSIAIAQESNEHVEEETEAYATIFDKTFIVNEVEVTPVTEAKVDGETEIEAELKRPIRGNHL